MQSRNNALMDRLAHNAAIGQPLLLLGLEINELLGIGQRGCARNGLILS